jgi:hypothetical protein
MNRLGEDLSSYPIPAGMERKEATMGKGKRQSTASTNHLELWVPDLAALPLI